MNYNNESFNNFASSTTNTGGRKLFRRPMETPGLESIKSNPDASSFQQVYFSNTTGTMPPPPLVTNDQSATEYSNYSRGSAFSFPSGSGTASVLSDPLVGVAMHMVGSGKELFKKEVEKYVPNSELKYYFAVDTVYVTRKLGIILFPYFHSDWSVKYEQSKPIQPKLEVNSPDLYIPTMAFLTYVLVAGLILGTKSQFSPEKLSIEATNALAWTALEVILQLVTLYISNINTSLKTFDLIAYSSYKYVGIIMTVLVNLAFGYVGYIMAVIYVSSSIAFFLMRTLTLQILTTPVLYQQDLCGSGGGVTPQNSLLPNQGQGLKRSKYFLLIVACIQPTLIWWLTWRIV